MFKLPEWRGAEVNKSTIYIYAIMFLILIAFVWGMSPIDIQLRNMVVALILILVGTFAALWRNLTKIQTKLNEIEDKLAQAEIKLRITDEG